MTEQDSGFLFIPSKTPPYRPTSPSSSPAILNSDLMSVPASPFPSSSSRTPTPTSSEDSEWKPLASSSTPSRNSIFDCTSSGLSGPFLPPSPAGPSNTSSSNRVAFSSGSLRELERDIRGSSDDALGNQFETDHNARSSSRDSTSDDESKEENGNDGDGEEDSDASGDSTIVVDLELASTEDSLSAAVESLRCSALPVPRRNLSFAPPRAQHRVSSGRSFAVSIGKPSHSVPDDQPFSLPFDFSSSSDRSSEFEEDSPGWADAESSADDDSFDNDIEEEADEEELSGSQDLRLRYRTGEMLGSQSSFGSMSHGMDSSSSTSSSLSPSPSGGKPLPLRPPKHNHLSPSRSSLKRPHAPARLIPYYSNSSSSDSSGSIYSPLTTPGCTPLLETPLSGPFIPGLSPSVVRFDCSPPPIIPTWSPVEYPGRKGDPPLQRLTYSEHLELIEVKNCMGRWRREIYGEEEIARLDGDRSL